MQASGCQTHVLLAVQFDMADVDQALVRPQLQLVSGCGLHPQGPEGVVDGVNLILHPKDLWADGVKSQLEVTMCRLPLPLTFWVCTWPRSNTTTVIGHRLEAPARYGQPAQ